MGMTRKGKNMVIHNKPTRVKNNVESGHVPLEHNFDATINPNYV